MCYIVVMPARIQQLLRGRQTQIDYPEVIAKYPWIVEKDIHCIISPDSDGLLCALFMQHFRNWRVAGFYDTKVMVRMKDVAAKDCVFLDAEIFRKNIRSVGQHMLLFNRNGLPPNWENFNQCLSPNNLRQYDGTHDFRLKYPLATIHFLIGILNSLEPIDIPVSAITPLIFTDGTYHNLFRYTENCLNWLHYLRADDPKSALYKLFRKEKYSFWELMKEMDEFWRVRDEISVSRERGDRIALTLRGGEGDPFNLEEAGGVYQLKDDPKIRAEKFIALLSKLTGWKYDVGQWAWGGWELFRFTKEDLTRLKLRLNNSSFITVLENEPLSFAMTSGQNLEYTMEQPDKFC
jgi:hypothetical protein